jgi:hypothetical protein
LHSNTCYEFFSCQVPYLCPDKDDFDGRFLVSFAGKYLAHDYCVALPQVHTKGGSGLHHQLYKILTHCIEPNLLGPLFIEVRIMLCLVVLLSKLVYILGKYIISTTHLLQSDVAFF